MRDKKRLRRVRHAEAAAGQEKDRENRRPAPGHGGEREKTAPGPAGARTVLPRDRAAPLPEPGQPGGGGERGALLHPALHPGPVRDRGTGRAGAGQRGAPAAHAPGGPRPERPAHRLRAALPPGALPAPPDCHLGRAEELLRPPGGADLGGSAGRRPRGRETAGAGPDSDRLRGPDRPAGRRPPGPAHPAGRTVGEERLRPGGGLLSGLLHRLHPPAAPGAGGAAGPGSFGDGGPDLRRAEGGPSRLRPRPLDRPGPAGRGEGPPCPGGV